MVGTKVEIYFAHRDKPLSLYTMEFTPKEVNESWSAACARKASTFNMTDRNGTEVSIVPSQVQVLAALPWNGV